MQKSWAKSYQLAQAHEGGLVDHPKDPGGRTNRGVTQVVYDAYRKARGKSQRLVDSIEDFEVQEIFGEQYWDICGAPELPAGLDYAVFDYAINSGPVRAVKDLQRVIGAPVDGHFGKVTLAKAEAMCQTGEEDLILAYCQRRVKFMKSLKNWSTFGKGWLRRVEGSKPGAQEDDKGVVDYAIMMARNDLSYPIMGLMLPAPIGAREGEVAAKAPEASQAQLKTAQGAGLSVAALGVVGQTLITTAQQLQPHISETVLGKAAMVGVVLLMGTGGLLVAASYLSKLKETGFKFT